MPRYLFFPLSLPSNFLHIFLLLICPIFTLLDEKTTFVFLFKSQLAEMTTKINYVKATKKHYKSGNLSC